RRAAARRAARTTRALCRHELGASCSGLLPACRAAEGGLAKEMHVVAAVLGRGPEGGELELRAELVVHVAGRVVRAAEARSRRAVVEHHDVTVQERSALVLRQPLQGEVVLAER